MANIKFIAVSRSLSGILDYVTNREKTVERLISGVNCMAQTAQDEFEAVKKQFRKTDGRSYYHIVQAFAPDDPLDFDTAHEIGLKFAKYFKGYQCVVVTHMNTAHIRIQCLNRAVVSTVLQYLSAQVTAYPALDVGGIRVRGHICLRIIIRSSPVSRKYRSAFSRAAFGWVNP